MNDLSKEELIKQYIEVETLLKVYSLSEPDRSILLYHSLCLRDEIRTRTPRISLRLLQVKE